MEQEYYSSKHFTAEQIDQRLLKGTYDDAVVAGYQGTKEEFDRQVATMVSSSGDSTGNQEVDNAYIKVISEAIRKVPQTLTEAEKTQARTNINAVGKTDIVNDLTTGGADKALSAEMGKELLEKSIYVWQQGSVAAGTPYLYDAPNRIRCFVWKNTKIEVKDGYLIKWLFYKDSNGTYAYQTINSSLLTCSRDGYVVVLRSDDNGLTPKDDFLLLMESPTSKQSLEFYDWVQGSVSTSINSLIQAPNRIRLYTWRGTRIIVKNGYFIKWFFYKDNTNRFTYLTINSNSYTTPIDGYVVVTKSDDSNLTPNDDFLELFNSPIQNLIPQFKDFETYYAVDFNWVQGGIVGNGGEPTVGQDYYNNRIKTNNPILSQGEIITFVVNSDYKIRAFQYSSEMTFESYLGEFTNNQTLATISGDNYRFVLLRKDGGNISIGESVNCNILGFHADASNGELRYKKPSYSSVPLRNNLRDKRVAFLGDSITQGAAASSQAQTYHGVFCSLYGAIDRTAEVYAEKGSSSNNLLGMNGTCIAANTKNGLGSTRFVTRATAENFADSKLIVVFGGTNDLSYDRKPIGELFVKETIAASGNMGTQRLTKPTDTETFAGALHELITTIQNVAPKVPIVFMTPMKRDHNSAQNPDYLTCNANGDFMIDYVNAIKEICAFYSIPVLDMYSNSQLNPLAPGWSSLFGDGLHPNNEGHALIGELLFRFVEDNVIVV